MPELLTKKQKEILDFVLQYYHEREYMPSYREIAKHFQLNSISTVHKHLQTLKRKGYVDFEYNKPRSLSVSSKIQKLSKAIEIPLVGLIAAGEPIEAIEERESLAVPEQLVDRDECFALKVRGDSMIEDGIFDGDFVVIEKNYYPNNGDVVVALIDNENATLKRYYREKSRIRLQPANSTMKPIYVKNPAIQGRVRAVYRKYF